MRKNHLMLDMKHLQNDLSLIWADPFISEKCCPYSRGKANQVKEFTFFNFKKIYSLVSKQK